MGSKGAEAARTGLDKRAVVAEADRPYVASMLRRLGYSEAQVADYLAGRTNAPSGRPHCRTADDSRTGRDIEVEYTGPGLRPYRLVIPRDLEFAAQHDLEFTEVPPASDTAWQPADAFLGWEQDGWRLYRSNEPTGDAVADHRFARSDEAAPEAASAAYVPDGYQVEWNEKGEPILAPLATMSEVPTDPRAPAEPAFEGWEENGWRLYRAAKPKKDVVASHRFARSEEKPPRKHVPAQVPDGYRVSWDEAGTPRLESMTQAWSEVPAPGSGAGFEQGDWRLYSKDEGDGEAAQRIFFFSREKPDQAVPAEVPEGYEVATNPETGRPFLRKVQDDEPVQSIDSAYPGLDSTTPMRKRVRIVRVRATDREAAQRKMEREGRTVLATMPIDIEKKVT